MDYDVVVVGAGLAGLRCAERVAATGRTVAVLEAGDAVGGRQRTDAVDGFLLDRGFQVLTPAYPAVRRWVDVGALELRPFGAGVLVRRDRGLVTLGHPLRDPRGIPASLRSGLLTPRSVVALARWAGPAVLFPRRVVAGPDRPVREGLDRVGLRGPLRPEVLEPFLAGVLAEDGGDTSDAFVRLLVRMFALGLPGVPARGIRALPEQLAARVRGLVGDVRLGEPVVTVGTSSVVTAAGDRVTAGAVVVAVGPDAVADLLPVPRPATKGLRTWWFAAPVPPTRSPVPPLQTRSGARPSAGAFVCGDHRDTASIQGALVPGDRVATAVLATLSGVSPPQPTGRPGRWARGRDRSAGDL